MAGLLELLLEGGQRAGRARLGGEDTPAGGGILDAVGQQIMARQLQQAPQQAQPQYSASAMPAQQPAQAPQSAPASPSVSMPNQGGGGILGALFGGNKRGNINSTVQWLVGKGYDPGAAQAIASDPQSLRAAMMQAGGPGQGSEYQQRQQAMREAGIDLNSPEGRQYFLTGSLPKTGADARAKFGLQPQYGVDANGNPVLLQLSDAGEAETTRLPDGVTLSKEPIRLDAGTHWVLLDPITRQPVGQVAKNLEEAETQKTAGKARGEDTATLESLESKMPGLEKVVQRLDELSEKATYTAAGVILDEGMRQMGMEPREAAIARSEYTAIVDNQILPLLRDTFGAQFTEREGQTLRATLGDPNMSPPEKQALLKAFIEQKRRDIEGLRTRTGRTSRVEPESPGAERMGTAGEWADVGGVRIRRQIRRKQ